MMIFLDESSNFGKQDFVCVAGYLNDDEGWEVFAKEWRILLKNMELKAFIPLTSWREIREREGNSLPAVFRTEGQALSFIRSRIAKGTIVNADDSPSWNDLHARFEMKRINHEEAYSLDGACTNWAEEFFSRMRRAEIGHHHHVAGPYLLRFAQEASWREDNRRLSDGEQVNRLGGLALRRGPSVDFSGYWQRHISP